VREPAAVELDGGDLRKAGGEKRRAAHLEPEVAGSREEEIELRHFPLAPDIGRAVLRALVGVPAADHGLPRLLGAEVERPHLAVHLRDGQQRRQVVDPPRSRAPARRASQEQQGQRPAQTPPGWHGGNVTQETPHPGGVEPRPYTKKRLQSVVLRADLAVAAPPACGAWV